MFIIIKYVFQFLPVGRCGRAYFLFSQKKFPIDLKPYALDVKYTFSDLKVVAFIVAICTISLFSICQKIMFYADVVIYFLWKSIKSLIGLVVLYSFSLTYSFLFLIINSSIIMFSFLSVFQYLLTLTIIRICLSFINIISICIVVPLRQRLVLLSKLCKLIQPQKCLTTYAQHRSIVTF